MWRMFRKKWGGVCLEMSTRIEWTDETWNPVTGCSPISPGCANCYAKRMATRLAGRYGYPKDNSFKPTFHLARINQPQQWKKPKRVFVCSMGDLFHEEVLDDWIEYVFETMLIAHHHTFMLLTKRPERMREFVGCLPFVAIPNIWLGVTAEDQKRADERIPILCQIPAAKRFVSIEPMLGPVDLEAFVACDPTGYEGWVGGIDWVIVGGESGLGARPMHPDWARSVRDQCQTANVPYFFKQWGEWAPDCLCDRQSPCRDVERPSPGRLGAMFKCGKKAAGHLLDGREWRETPNV